MSSIIPSLTAVQTAVQIASTYSWLRSMSGGKLTKDQVIAGDEIIAKVGLDVFARSIGYSLTDKVISGQWDISSNGYALIKQSEGYESNAYLDTGGVWTIGFGTIKYPNGAPVKKGDTCTQDQANQWLINDCKWVDSCLDKALKVKLTQNQFDALASFVYNVGETAFSKSTMLTLINKGDFKGAAGQFDRWIYDNGKVINGLVNRRKIEKALFLK